MHLIRGITHIPSFKKRFQSVRTVATIGNFDGLHLGHQRVLGRVKARAEQYQLPTLVFFTEPHAQEFFTTGTPPPRLSPWRDKVLRLCDYGIEFGFFLKFNAAFRQMTAGEFIEQVLEAIDIKHLVIGDDFRFGVERQGDFELLRRWGSTRDVMVESTDTFLYGGERVSSTRIRRALLDNDFDLARQLLGRPYTFSGRVVYGNRLGRGIGTPTANIRLPVTRLPVSGVYAVRARLADEQFSGVANMGTRPTVNGQHPVLEVHLFDFDRQIYGRRLEVEFLHKLREEKKFPNLTELQSQIAQDLVRARELLAP